MSQKKVVHGSESYSHPLLRSMQETPLEDHSAIVPTYQPLIASHRNRTSSKLLRYTTLAPNLHSSFTLFASLLHPIIDELPLLTTVAQCPLCQCIVNPNSKLQNYSQLTCNLCGQASEIQAYTGQQYKDTHAYTYMGNTPKQQDEKYRVCLVIEASQENYQSHVHRGIISCLRSIDEDLQVALVFIDNKSISFVNQGTLEVTKMSIPAESALEGWDALPISQAQLFTPISGFGEEVEDIIEGIMYEAFYIKQTVLSSATSLLSRFLPKNCFIKFFISTLPNSTPQQQQSKLDFLSAFRQRQNQSKLQPNPKQSKLRAKRGKIDLTLSQNMQFFIIPKNNTPQQELIDALGYRLHRIYRDQLQRLQQNIYYDLYENITVRHRLNTVVTIRTNTSVQLVTPSFPYFDLYGNLQLISAKIHTKYRQYKLTVGQCHSATTLPLKFNISAQSSSQTPFFQITYHNDHSRIVVLNGSCLKLSPQDQINLEWLDDEALFNQHLRSALSRWDGEDAGQLRHHLQAEYEWLIRLFRNTYKYDSINFPKTMKHYFLYVHSLIEKLPRVDSSTIYQMATSNLQTFSKRLYPRCYRLESGAIKNVKSNKAIFQNYPLVFMDDGEDLLMILSDASVEETKAIFGYFDTVASLANSHYELPQLETNCAYRKAINVIRTNNPYKFLQLRIIDTQSSLFESRVLPQLYNKSRHVDFLRKAWKNA